MAYTEHLLIAFSGNWVDETEESWECTVRATADGGGGVTVDPEAYLTAIKTPLATWFTLNASGMANKAQLAHLKANLIGADGLYVDKTTTHLRDYSPVVAGGSGQIFPGFCSLAFTWETAKLRGPGHRGRIYPPNPAGTIGTALRVNAATRDQAATAGKNLLAVLRNAAGANGTKPIPVVASKVDGSLTTITGCSCDDIVDVQRRRKRSAVGGRSAVIAFP